MVGAGPAGLAAAASLARADLTYRLLERAERVAPAWHGHYDRLHLHTPKRHSALPFAPLPADYPVYPSRRQMIAYFDRYAERLPAPAQLGETVERAARADGGWTTVTDRDTYRSRALIVAAGLNARPVCPEWPGRAGYHGRLLHSSDYRNPAPFTGQRVLVVGFGNSGGEIALDLAEHSIAVELSVRGPVNVVPRDVLGVPLVSISIALNALPARALDAVSVPIGRLRLGDLSRYGLSPSPRGPVARIRERARIPLIDIGTIARIKTGAIGVRPGIRRFTPDGVTFTDGATARYDAVILATGYRPDLGFLDGVTLPDDTQALPTRGAPGPLTGLFFTGFRVTNTGTLREIGIETRRIARQVALGG